MAQAIWQFVSNTGFKHKIGVYHGDGTGHVLIYCDKRIVKIDFNVKEPTEYAFFVDDEFCRIELYKEPDGRFSYDFVIDKVANTPLNAERKLEDKKNLRSLWLFSIATIAAVALFFVGTRAYQHYLSVQNSGWAGVVYFPNKSVQEQLHKHGQLATVRLYPKPGNKQIGYAFTPVQGHEITGTLALPNSTPILPNGFELYPGDTYQLRYDPNQPTHHMLDFMAPTPDQVRLFAQRALAMEQRRSQSGATEADMCFIKTILEVKGWESLQHIINQFVPPSANSNHNSDSYLRLCRSPEVESAVKDACWGVGR
jgi:hypothetical protein